MPNAQKVMNMFNRVAAHYDLLNDLLSLGVHRLWKRKLVKHALEVSPKTLLDGATGTGDIAHMATRSRPSCKVTGIDFSVKMLDAARNRFPQLDFYEGDLTNLSQFNDKSFDVSTVSYGVRNVDSLDRCLKELGRVTSKRVCILEFGAPQSKVWRKIYFFFMRKFMPALGQLFGMKQDYRYLIESSAAFPSGPEFEEIVKKNIEITKIKTLALFGGVTYLYIIDL